MWSMCRTKKKSTFFTVLFVLVTFSLSACGFTGKMFTDAGAGKQQELAKEDYLKTDAVSEQDTQTAEEKYQVYTLGIGTYTESIPKKTLKKWEGGMKEVRYPLAGSQSRLKGFSKFFEYVEQGEAVAAAYIEVDELALPETRMRLKRLEERLIGAEAQMNQDLQEIQDQKALIYNDYKKEIMDIRYQQRQQDWALEKYNFESQIEDTKRGWRD